VINLGCRRNGGAEAQCSAPINRGRIRAPARAWLGQLQGLDASDCRRGFGGGRRKSKTANRSTAVCGWALRSILELASTRRVQSPVLQSDVPRPCRGSPSLPLCPHATHSVFFRSLSPPCLHHAPPPSPAAAVLLSRVHKTPPNLVVPSPPYSASIATPESLG
jgi:hypothetical protein